MTTPSRPETASEFNDVTRQEPYQHRGFCKRIIPCLDVSNGRTVKGIQFSQLRDVGDPVELAKQYQEDGADELMFLDISATVDGHETMVSVVQAVATELSIPFSVGGGIRRLADAKALLDAGADKVSVNSAAVKTPALITEIANAFGSQCCVLAIDARLNTTGNLAFTEVLTHGGKKPTGKEVLTWAKEGVERGAGEILLTSWDRDGTLDGFDLPLTQRVSAQLSVPVIASGGAKDPDSFVDVFTAGCADAALAASIFHDGRWKIAALKRVLMERGITVRQ
ncbi:MAG: imidazole glycerol phosphate synthase subunit HisF [Cyanobacteria bacterium P01_H01_bin.74]